MKRWILTILSKSFKISKFINKDPKVIMAMSECQCEIKKLTKTIRETKSPELNYFAQNVSITQFFNIFHLQWILKLIIEVYLSKEDHGLGAIHKLSLSFNQGDKSWGSCQLWQAVPMRSSGSSNYLQVHVFDMQSRENSLAHFSTTWIFKFDFSSYFSQELLQILKRTRSSTDVQN